VDADDHDPAAESAARAVLPHAWGPAATVAAGEDQPAVGDSTTRGDQPEAAHASESSADSASAGAPVGTPAPWGASGDLTPGEHAAHEEPVSLDEAPFDAILGQHPGAAALDEASSATAEHHRPAFHAVSAPELAATDHAGSSWGGEQAPHAAADAAPHGD